jgi:large subunit ribosomal protein L22
MTGPKLNEAPVRRKTGLRPPGDTPSAKAVGRYIRISPYKVREVLDIIRGQDAERALEILKFSERDAATAVAKVVASAIANAEHNESLPAEELYVSACFADEGPTLKRWRPRARGRATRIRKRTCHITVIVTRLPEEEAVRRRRAAEAARRGRRPARRARTGAAAPATTPQSVEEPTVEEPIVEEPTAEAEDIASESVDEEAVVVEAEAEEEATGEETATAADETAAEDAAADEDNEEGEA